MLNFIYYDCDQRNNKILYYEQITEYSFGLTIFCSIHNS